MDSGARMDSPAILLCSAVLPITYTADCRGAPRGERARGGGGGWMPGRGQAWYCHDRLVTLLFYPQSTMRCQVIFPVARVLYYKLKASPKVVLYLIAISGSLIFVFSVFTLT